MDVDGHQMDSLDIPKEIQMDFKGILKKLNGNYGKRNNELVCHYLMRRFTPSASLRSYPRLMKRCSLRCARFNHN